jgi:cytochrome c biogenesis protein CcmG, thiol:disulfide interchange protein DsbE
MKKLRPEYITRALLVLLVGAFIFAVLRPGNAGLAPGDSVPDFSLTDLSGRPVRLADYQGKVVVLNFWATWCPPCVEEMPSLKRFNDEFASRGVVVLAVSEDDDEQALRRFIDTHQIRFTVARDPGRKVAASYQTYKYPETYILDRRGKLLRKIVGPEDWSSEAMRAYFQGII